MPAWSNQRRYKLLEMGSAHSYDQSMNKFLVALCLICALALTTSAGEKKKKNPPPTAQEYKAMYRKMLDKYDINGDGKLVATELSKMNEEDKLTWKKAYPRRGMKDDKTR
jgi:hypothetical protein